MSFSSKNVAKFNLKMEKVDPQRRARNSQKIYSKIGKIGNSSNATLRGSQAFIPVEIQKPEGTPSQNQS